MSDGAILAYHGHLIAIEKNTNVLTLISRYLRGQIYTLLQSKCRTRDELHTKSIRLFNLSADACYRFIRVTALLKSFPRLLFCNLSHSELDKFASKIRALDLPELKDTVTIRLADQVITVEEEAFELAQIAVSKAFEKQ